MFHIVLYEPEIPPNSGNIMRLCVNAGCQLHFIEPLGFELSDKQLRRAGLDYTKDFSWKIYPNFDTFLEKFQQQYPKNQLYLCSSKTRQLYSECVYKSNDAFVFGPESRGLPQTLKEKHPELQWITIPMKTTSRSLNLSNAASIIVYEAWRQNDFLA